MTIASDDIKTLVEIVGRLGAQVALSRSDKIRAEELLKIAENLGIRLPKRTSKSEVAIAIIKHVDRRIDKSLDDLKKLSDSEMLQYFSDVDPDTEEIIELLLSIDIKNRIRSRKGLFEFAAKQISSLGVFERLAHPSDSIQAPKRHTELSPLRVRGNGSAQEANAVVNSDSPIS